MFLKKKHVAWYWKTLGILVFLRIIYAFARFFMRIVDRHADRQVLRKPGA